MTDIIEEAPLPQAEFPIDTDIPIPTDTMHRGRNANRLKYPWPGMCVGDSILVSDRYQGLAAAACAASWGKRRGKSFTSRFSAEGVRIWRVV